ncbi:pectate lyase [Mariniflexile litorale]|uniref:Pectate lyase n=1 Tax=Mariniflexile litorale TaxID=3045158 RepID=A0AAU7EKZ6_9FLAO|nr:pectate lyase [Mariniflexile sp. KMM 9835]MDQ8210599.1 pectate lyase [Mariniflexile sp. KMM 9835]
MRQTNYILLVFSFFILGSKLEAQQNISEERVLGTMLKATEFMVENVSTNGGYVWYYMPDFSRQWGEMEAYKTMIWLQHPGTISMGHVFLDAFRVTQNEYYYKAAEKAARAIIWGQSPEGGWNYMIDFAGDRSLKQWYNTIGKNGWRLEEFQHYYGNSTFDDDVTTDAARFLLRMYLEKMDPTYKPALDKAIDFILKSQYINGGWPQRYPLKYDFNKQGFPDYSSFYTFNDDVIWENINFLMQCYLVLGQERFLDPISRGMKFYKISQASCGAWGQQVNMKMEATSARTYEPAAFLPGATCENALLLIKFYRLTGDKQFLEGIPKAIKWLEEVKLPIDKIEGHRTHPTFVDIKTNKPIYVHRKGSNAKYGRYYVDEDDKNLLSHYYGKGFVNLQELKDEYEKILKLSVEEVTQDSPLKPQQFQHKVTPQSFYDLNRHIFNFKIDESKIVEVVEQLDSQNRWLSDRAFISNPYIGDGVNTETTHAYATTRVGDETDTSPYPDTTNQEYISTGTYIRNMKLLINYIQSYNNK